MGSEADRARLDPNIDDFRLRLKPWLQMARTLVGVAAASLQEELGIVRSALQPVSALWKNLTDVPLRSKAPSVGTVSKDGKRAATNRPPFKTPLQPYYNLIKTLSRHLKNHTKTL